jgi:replicative DNA helicase
MGHGQPVPINLWSDRCLRVIAREIDLTFMGERNNELISKESLVTAYTSLSESSRPVSVIEFSKTISELSDPYTLDRYGDAKAEWATALDILKQVRVRANYLELLHTAKQNFKADTNLEEQLSFLQQKALEGVSMMRGAIGNQGQAVDIVQSIIGDPGENRKNWIDYIYSAEKTERPVSTGIAAVDLDIDGGVCRPQHNRNIGGRVLTLAARTAGGKTAFGVDIATSLVSGGLTVGFISAELALSDIEARVMASFSRKVFGRNSNYYWKNQPDYLGYITVGDIKTPDLRMKGELAALLAKIAKEVQDGSGNLLIEAPWGACVDAVINSLRSMKAKHPELRAAVIDHFHVLARHKNASRNDASMLEERAYKLTTAAKELDIDIFVLAQMNQVGMKVSREQGKVGAPEPAPQLDQIRGTDALSHVSHAVWLMRQKKHESDDPRERKIEFWHSKVRGRQAVWEETDSGPQIHTMQHFIEMSEVQMEYNVCTCKWDNTLIQVKMQMSSCSY